MHFEQTADSDTVSIYQVSLVQLVTDKKLEALNKQGQRPLIHEEELSFSTVLSK